MASEVNRRVAKAVAMFSSMQMVQTVCAMVRIKIITTWLGAAGVALMGIYMTAVELIGAVTQLGIRTSAVKDISASAGVPVAVASVIKVVRRFGVALGLLGAVVIILLSGALSRWSFGDTTHIWSFCVLGIALIFQSLTGASQVVFQGLGKLKQLASAGLWGAIGGLVLSVPLYWFLGLDGVALSIVAYSVALWFPYFVMRKHVAVRSHSEPLSATETMRRGAGFVKVGFYLTISSILGYLVNYVFLSYVNVGWGDEISGLFQAGYTMLWRYVAILFVSVGYEYYPRLAASARSGWRMEPMVSHQGIFTGMLMLPCACIAVAASPLLIRILYNGDFMPMLPYFVIGMAGMMFRPVSVAVSYVFLSTGRGGVYSLTEILSNLIGLGLNVVAFRCYGFLGLGVATVIWMALDSLLMLIFYRRMGMRLNRKVIPVTLAFVGIVALCAVLQLCGLWWVVLIVAAVAAVPALKSLTKSS